MWHYLKNIYIAANNLNVGEATVNSLTYTPLGGYPILCSFTFVLILERQEAVYCLYGVKARTVVVAIGSN